MTNKFNARVTTIILRGQTPELNDTMEFIGVTREFIEFLAGSCRLVVRRLFESKREPDGEYSLHYETKITTEGGEAINKLPPVTQIGMTRAQVHSFLRLAMIELAEANDLRYGEFSECRSDD